MDTGSEIGGFLGQDAA